MGEDRVGDVIHAAHGHGIAGASDDDDRSVRGIDLAISGLAREISREIGVGGIDCGLNVARGGVDVAAEVELQRDGSRAE